MPYYMVYDESFRDYLRFAALEDAKEYIAMMLENYGDSADFIIIKCEEVK